MGIHGNLLFRFIDRHRDCLVAVAEDEQGEQSFKAGYGKSIESVESLLSHFDKPPKVVVRGSE